MYQTILVLHVLGATVWTGGHLILAIGFLPAALRANDPAVLQSFERRYERIGIPALVVQVLTGFWLAHRYVPATQWLSFDGFPADHVGAKIVLLLATVAFAVHARLRVLPRLGSHNLRFLAFHVVSVTVIGVLLVVVGLGIRTGGVF